jgi:hypothetical protein
MSGRIPITPNTVQPLCVSSSASLCALGVNPSPRKIVYFKTNPKPRVFATRFSLPNPRETQRKPKETQGKPEEPKAGPSAMSHTPINLDGGLGQC